VQILRNVLFRNENSGAYFYRGSLGGLAHGNLVYENAVGIRFGSRSNAGIAIDNMVLDNKDAGLSFEKVAFQVSSHNTLKGNTSQLRLIKPSLLISDNNCYETATEAGQLLAMVDLTVPYQKLSEFINKVGQDFNSSDGNCAVETAKVDVGALHAETLSYLKRAQQILRDQ
jgi:hypothetical protein